jgi:hypothetical protein
MNLTFELESLISRAPLSAWGLLQQSFSPSKICHAARLCAQTCLSPESCSHNQQLGTRTRRPSKPTQARFHLRNASSDVFTSRSANQYNSSAKAGGPKAQMAFNRLGTGYVLFSVLHVVLIILAATVAGLYGVDVGKGERPDGFGDSRWVFAIVVACLSALTAVLYLIPFVLRFMAVWIWNLIMFILWIALFGVFGKVCLLGMPTESVFCVPTLYVCINPSSL